MGMGVSQTPSSSKDFLEENSPEIIAEINITPLTDIFLVLLVIFMVTSSVMSQMGIQVQLPQSQQSAASAEKPSVIVTVTKGGEIAVNGDKLKDHSLLEEILKAALARSTDKTIILEGDREAVLGTVVNVMDAGKKAGALKFAVATSSK